MATPRLSEKAGSLNLTIEQGATFNPVFTWKDQSGIPIDLSGYSGRMHVRAELEDVATLLEVTTANGYMILGGSAGTVTLDVPASITAALDFDVAVYDLELESGTGEVTRLLKGTVLLSPEVTR
jgi:hypothetical protein